MLGVLDAGLQLYGGSAVAVRLMQASALANQYGLQVLAAMARRARAEHVTALVEELTAQRAEERIDESVEKILRAKGIN